jgi:hypothetical protein
LKRIFFSSHPFSFLFYSPLHRFLFRLFLSSIFFKCFSIIRYNTFSFVSINLLHKQTSVKNPSGKNKKNVETLSESFTSRGKARLQYRVTASAENLKRQKSIEYKDVAQARDYANMTKSTKPETNWTASTLPHCIVIPSAQRNGPRLQQFSTKQTTTLTVIRPRFYPASKRETQGRNITENKHGSSKHATTPATAREPRAQKFAPNFAFRSLTNHSN